MNKLMPWHTVILVWIKKMVGIIDVKKRLDMVGLMGCQGGLEVIGSSN